MFTQWHLDSFVYEVCQLCPLDYVVSLRKLEEQPEWLKGGTLRDYQLEGLNFLMNRSVHNLHLLFLQDHLIDIFDRHQFLFDFVYTVVDTSIMW